MTITALGGDAEGLADFLRRIFESPMLTLPPGPIPDVPNNTACERVFVQILVELPGRRAPGTLRRDHKLTSMQTGTCLLAWIREQFPGYSGPTITGVDAHALTWAIRERMRQYRELGYPLTDD